MIGIRSDLVTTSHREESREYQTVFVTQPKILYFGNWSRVSDPSGDRHQSNTHYNAFEFPFKGSTVKWIGSKRKNHGYADVYIDGVFQETVDCYSAETVTNATKFERTSLSEDGIHTLRVVVRKERNPDATDCYQDITSVQAVDPICYPIEIARAMNAEYAAIQNGTKPYLPPEKWSPVPTAAKIPANGVTLGPGLFKDVFNRNISYLNHCYASQTYCDGLGWSEWLPASNEGRMLMGAANTLRWEERADMRAMVDTIVANIENRMRDDGYYNYYDESDSYALNTGRNSERKNYDRVFWTRGLLAAGMVGNSNAYGPLRKMYDWFNKSPYLPEILLGGNATNGLPGGPLMYLSPVGTESDLLVTLRYYDQDYWINELKNRQPLCLTYYPGERPHCYDLLGYEAFVDEYKATGASKYLDAVRGGWEIYKNNFKHVGGATAIMESFKLFPPQNYYFTTTLIGEACGSVFWIDVNSKLLQLDPTREEYATEIEESIYNVIFAAQDSRGYIRYHNILQGNKREPVCNNTCCEVSSVGLIARLPEFIYSTAADGIYINLYVPSSISWTQDDHNVSLQMTTDFPFDPTVSMRISTGKSVPMTIRVRVPSWATVTVVVSVNGSEFARGQPGSYLSLTRTWSDNDSITFTLPIGFTTVKYTGLDQIEGNYDRYALLYGPILLALQGEMSRETTGPGGVPQIAVAADSLPTLLEALEGMPHEFRIKGYPGYKYMPYWKLNTEEFTCFPIVQP